MFREVISEFKKLAPSLQDEELKFEEVVYWPDVFYEGKTEVRVVMHLIGYKDEPASKFTMRLLIDNKEVENGTPIDAARAMLHVFQNEKEKYLKGLKEAEREILFGKSDLEPVGMLNAIRNPREDK